MSAARNAAGSPPSRPRRRAGGMAIGAAVVVVAGVASWWLFAHTPGVEVRATPDQNVLLITIDTLRGDALGCYGGRADTPNIDRLAASGVRFDFAHAHAVTTLPSHTSILTGRYPFQHGIRDNSGFRVAPDTVTLATLLKARGFATAAFIGGFPLAAQFGLGVGFDLYDDRLNPTRETSDFYLAERRADVVVGSAQAWLGKQRSKWFAWVHLFDPHAPYAPPEPYATRFASDRYSGEVSFVDAALGPLLEAVRADSARPTLVIVTGDHGEGLGDHGEETHGIFAYEATLRIPLITAQVGGDRAAGPAAGRGTARATPVQHVDILPTVLGALGTVELWAGPGRSLLGDAQDADVRASYFEALSASLNRGWAPLTGVLVGREKYIDLPETELFDVARDSAERTNLARVEAQRRAVMAARLAAFGPLAPGERRQESAETIARLRALGYTAGTSTPSIRKVYTVEDDPKRLVGLDQAMHRGVSLFQAGRRREAEDVFQGLVAQRPEMSVAYMHLAFLQWEQGRPADAIATLKRGRPRVGGHVELDARLGLYLAESGAAAEALPLVEHAAAQPEAGVETFNILGIVYTRLGRRTDAIATFRRILALDSRNAMAWQNMGMALLEERRHAEARAAFERAIDANPNWSAAYTGLGVEALRSGDRGAAVAAWRRAVELDPSAFDALFNLATELVNDRQWSAARPYVERFVATAPPTAYATDIARLRHMLDRWPR